MVEFKEGDYVSHPTGKHNHGLGMEITGIDADRVRCEWFEGAEAVHNTEWFDKEDLILLSETDGGFRNEGE